jgi:hypothetical protein
MRVFLVNESNSVAISLVKKLAGVKHGQLIPVTADEFRFAKGGGLLAVDLPTTSGRLTTGAGANNAKPTEGPKPAGNALKSPVS